MEALVWVMQGAVRLIFLNLAPQIASGLAWTPRDSVEP